MPIFRKRRGEPLDLEERSPELGIKYKDLAVIGQFVKHGVDLSEVREINFFCYAPDQPSASSIADEAQAKGFQTEVRDPQPDSPNSWLIVSEIHTVLSVDFVRDARDFFEELAARHQAEFDGWDAAV